MKLSDYCIQVLELLLLLLDSYREGFKYTYEIAEIFHPKGPVLLTDEHKVYANRTQRSTTVSGSMSSVFIRPKNRQNCRKFAKEKWKRTNKSSM